MKTDIEIARAAKPEPIQKIAESLNIADEYLDLYGKNKAKIHHSLAQQTNIGAQAGKLVLVTAISPTPAGEGKTTTTVGLADALKQLKKKPIVVLREPSLGPVFGVKGGAAGGGYAQVIPMEDINLHFTGDIHAISAANNLLAALIDNHIFQGNSLQIDCRKISWRRCLDMNDRQLRNITNGLGGKANGVPREDGFDISVASEIMAVFCLAKDINDLKERLSRMVVAYTRDDKPITVAMLNAQGALAALLKDAINPNLVQTLEQTPAILHGGPFANIAHGCNSVIATKTALSLGEYIITEAGFGADLGLEKFIDIKCRMANIAPSAVVVVATIRALKYHGGVAKDDLHKENLELLEKGLPNLLQHVENITTVFGLPAVVALNKFPHDTEAELSLVKEKCAGLNTKVIVSDVWSKGGKGGVELAEEVVRLCEQKNNFAYCYELSNSIEEKIKSIVTRIYRGSAVEFSLEAKQQMARFEKLGYGELPICMAKTQYSFSDNAKLLGAPRNFTVSIRGLRLAAGAGFIVALAGTIMTMPGLPKIPAAESIDIDASGNIQGLF